MANMTLIETKTVGAGGASSIEFTSIPATYTDLKLVLSGRTGRAANGDDINISFNGSTSSFSMRFLYGNGATAYSASGTRVVGIVDGGSDTASTFGNQEIYIPNYTSSNNKSYSVDSVNENNGTTAFAVLLAGLWSNTAAITSISLTSNNSANWVQYSTASLYGISAVTSTPKATGGIITESDTYYYHTFPFTATFTPTTNLTNVDYLVIAGGGSGGSHEAGGGGAGGLRSTVQYTGGGGALESKISLNSGTAYTITVGAGGAGTASGTDAGTNGANSSIAGTGLTTITSTGGGGGGGGASGQRNGIAGGSGGGAHPSVGSVGGARTSSPVQGNKGGDYVNPGPGGGGGGAGGAGDSTNGVGGIGAYIPDLASFTYTGDGGYYAGGGNAAYGAGTSAPGGGTIGTGVAPGFNAKANTGGGGGAIINAQAPSGAGGSGLVIIRYAK